MAKRFSPEFKQQAIDYALSNDQQSQSELIHIKSLIGLILNKIYTKFTPHLLFNDTNYLIFNIY
ncbi:hypothetical protein ACW7EJ_16035, partial [Acinetobacter soli]